MDDTDDLGRLFLMVSGREKLTHYDRTEKESDGSLCRDWCVLVRARSRKPSIKVLLPSASPWWPIAPQHLTSSASKHSSAKPREHIFEQHIVKTNSGFGVTLRQTQQVSFQAAAFGPIVVSGYPQCVAGDSMRRQGEVLVGDELMEVIYEVMRLSNNSCGHCSLGTVSEAHSLLCRWEVFLQPAPPGVI
jgi:hypothetical protein